MGVVLEGEGRPIDGRIKRVEGFGMGVRIGEGDMDQTAQLQVARSTNDLVGIVVGEIV
jgi:hypothetical protein